MMQTTAQEALSRSNLYGLLARLVRTEVDAGMLAELRMPQAVEAFQACYA